MTPGSLLIRADASVAIGTGHVMRCLALAQAWQDAGGTAVFAAAEMPSPVEERLASEGFSITSVPIPAGSSEDANATAKLARECTATWVVVDGDCFDAAFLAAVKSSGIRVLLIDDFADRKSFPADLILNPNLDATEAVYRADGNKTPLLLGQAYVMLRREFAAERCERVFSENGGRVLVTFGGTDPENLTPRIAEALARLRDYEITVIAGPGNPNRLELERLGTQKVHVAFNPTNIRKLMAESDLAIVAAGGTLWELLHMGCAVLSYARNPVQCRVVEALEKRGGVRSLGATQDFDGSVLVAAVEELRRSKRQREQMANIGGRIVDGGGATRVVRALLDRGTGD